MSEVSWHNLLTVHLLTILSRDTEKKNVFFSHVNSIPLKTKVMSGKAFKNPDIKQAGAELGQG